MSFSTSSELKNPAVAAPQLQVRNLRKSFGGATVVDVAELSVRAHGVTALIGPNGAGKTTLFDLVSGFARPSEGRIDYGGTNLVAHGPEWRARHGLVRTFQLTRVFDRLTVLENMLLGVLPDRHLRLANSVLRWQRSRKDREKTSSRAQDLLAEVGLQPVAHLYAGQLSGGQKKLLEFSRARMTDPTLLLLDEPLAGVNPAIRERMLDHIRQFVSAGRGVLLVEHDLPRVMQIADRVVVLDRGKVIADGSPSLIADDPAVIKAYLGGAHR